MFFLRTGACILFSFELLTGFDLPMAQTKGPVKRKNSSRFQLDPSHCKTMRPFSRIFPQLRRRALFTRINLGRILDLSVDISPTIEQSISVFDRVAKKMRTYFEMGTDGHRFLCFQFGIS